MIITANKGNGKIFTTEAEAIKVAAALQADDDDFTYRVRVDPKGTGKALIDVIDETGAVLGTV